MLALAKGQCFPDAVPASQRRNLTRGEGDSFPLGMWVPTWSAGVLVSAVVEVLVKEKLGFVTATGGGSSTPDGFFAMAGCETPTDVADRRCGRKTTDYHIHVEGWTGGYRSTWDQIQEEYPETAPLNLGMHGYEGLSGQYISEPVIESAYNAEGLVLEFYRNYNSSWFDPAKYFDDVSIFNASEQLKPCNETRLMGVEAMTVYVMATGDWDGVDNSSGELKGRCFSGYWWLAVSCRANASKCVPFVTGGNGWGVEVVMHQSTVWHMPIAIVVAKGWGDYTSLPTKTNSMFYWWQPDPTFLQLHSKRLLFPPYDGQPHNGYESVPIDRYASFDLQALAPNAYKLLAAFTMNLKEVEALMTDQSETGDAASVVACRWLKKNEDLWKDWMPDTTACFPQFGLYNELTEAFVEDRTDKIGLGCRACSSGFYSSRLRDNTGITHVCKPCPVGTVQPSGASLQCDSCPLGHYQDEMGRQSCKRCPRSTYQDLLGQTSCKECPASTSTEIFGASAVTECGCDAGNINLANPSETPQCSTCGEGLVCPFSSSLHILTTGQTPLGVEYQTAIEQGYYSTIEKPLSVWKCISTSFCPGGMPERCTGGRVGTPCAECPQGFTWVEEEKSCEACDALTTSAWWIVLVLFLGLCSCAYYTTNPAVSHIATARQTVGVSFGLCSLWLQTVAILSTMTVAWPSSVEGPFSVFRIMLLDVETLSFPCLGSSRAVVRYWLTTLIFPGALLWMVLSGMASQCLPKRFAWQKTKTMNSMGHFLQVSFATMANIALQCMTCYAHPNGSHSLVKYSSVICNVDGDHAVMLGAGLLLLVIFVFGFLVSVTYATIKLPEWSARGLTQRVQPFIFLLYRFRMDKWWFGAPLLIRGPLMSLTVTCFTDFPDVQVGLNCLILTFSVVVQATARPWKVPLLNWIDIWATMWILQIGTLSGIGIRDEDRSEDFTTVYSAAQLMMIGCGIMAMLCGVVTAAVLEFRGIQDAGNSKILRCFESRSTGLAQDLLAMIPVLEQMSEEDLHKALSTFNNHDLTNLETAISVLVIEIPSINLNRTFSSSRVHLKSLVQKTLSKQVSIRKSKVSRNTSTKAKTQDEKPDEPLAQATTESPKDDLEESEEAEEEEQEDDNFPPNNRRTTGIVGEVLGLVSTAL